MHGKAELTTEELCERIETADGYEIDELLNAVKRRYDRLYPDSEILFLSFPRHDAAQREAAWNALMDYLRKHEHMDPG